MSNSIRSGSLVDLIFELSGLLEAPMKELNRRAQSSEAIESEQQMRDLGCLIFIFQDLGSSLGNCTFEGQFCCHILDNLVFQLHTVIEKQWIEEENRETRIWKREVIDSPDYYNIGETGFKPYKIDVFSHSLRWEEEAFPIERVMQHCAVHTMNFYTTFRSGDDPLRFLFPKNDFATRSRKILVRMFVLKLLNLFEALEMLYVDNRREIRNEITDTLVKISGGETRVTKLLCEWSPEVVTPFSSE